MQQEVVLAMLAKEPSHGYELRARLTMPWVRSATGSTPARFTSLWGASRRQASLRPMRRGLPLIARSARCTGSRRLARSGSPSGCTRSTWPRPDLAEFHLKLIAAAAARLADPISIVDAQRRELLRRLRTVQRAAMEEQPNAASGLLLEGIVLRLQADLRWLEACEREWTKKGES